MTITRKSDAAKEKPSMLPARKKDKLESKSVKLKKKAKSSEAASTLKPKQKLLKPKEVKLTPKEPTLAPKSAGGLKPKSGSLVPRESIILDRTGRPFSRELVTKPDPIMLPAGAYDDPLAFLQSLSSDSNANAVVEELKPHIAEIENELNLQSVILDAFQDAHRNMAPRDLRIDDNDFPQAPNLYRWVVEDRFSGTNDRPYLEQLIWGIMLFAEFCQRCTDMEWLLHDHKVNDTYATFEKKVALLEFGVCPCCGARKSQMYLKGEINFYQELAVRAGQRAGKSLTVGTTLSPYIMHRYLKLQKPPAAFGLSNNTTFIGTFVAINYAQAKEALWDYYYNAVSESNWFKGYHGMLKHYENQLGEHLMKFNDTFTAYRVRNLLIYPAGPDKRALRGRCLVGSTMVNTNHGFTSFKELVKHKGQVPAHKLTIDSHVGNVKVSHTYQTKATTIKLTTRNGFTIEGTEEHPMLVLTPELEYRWTRLDEIREGDWIVSKTANNKPMFGKSDVSKDLATLLGYHVANGYRNEISSDDPAVIKRLYRVFKRVTGHSPTSYGGEEGIRATTHYLATGTKGGMLHFLRDHLEPVGYRAVKSGKKEIPFAIRTAPAPILHEFLEAYFECDSGTNGGGNRNNAPSEIEIGSASKRLATQLQIILFQVYGILGRLDRKERFDKLNRKTGKYDARRVHWTVSITGSDAIQFLKCFKRAKVQKYADRYRDVPAGFGSDRRVLPHVRNFLWNFYEDARMQDTDGKRLRRLVCENGETILNTLKPNCIRHLRSSLTKTSSDATVSEYVVYEDDWGKLMPVLESVNSERAARLREFLELGAHYECVVSVKCKNVKKKVYDVTVPKHHAFTANCLTSHNTRMISSVDEIGWFDSEKDSKKVKVSGHAIYDALDRSLGTVRQAAYKTLRMGFDNIPNAYAMNVSSPSSLSDKICELTRLGQNSRTICAIHRPTWEINPEFPRDSEVIMDAYQKDPLTAERDWGANPPLISNPFIANHKYIIDTVGKKKNPFEIITKRKNGSNPGSAYSWAELVAFKESERPTLCGIDAGHVNNSFASVTGYKEDDHFIIDSIIEAQPIPGFPLNYNRMYEKILKPQMVFRNSRGLLADRWNSIKLLDDAQEELGVLKKQYNLKYKDLWYVKNAIEGGKVLLPRTYVKGTNMNDIINFDGEYPSAFDNRPVEHALFQMATVRDTGTQVLKGDNVTDDIFRAICIVIFGLVCGEFDEALMQQVEERRTGGGIAVGRFGSGGSRQLGQGVGSGSQIPLGTVKSFG